MACVDEARDRSIHHAKGQLEMVGVFNLCRARPRQMLMGHVVPPSPALLAGHPGICGLCGPPLFAQQYRVGRCWPREEKERHRRRC